MGDQSVAGNRSVQQRRFNRFRELFDHEPPYEALGQVASRRGLAPAHPSTASGSFSGEAR